MMPHLIAKALALTAGLAATLAGASAPNAVAWEPPPANAGFDYQIGGDYPLPDGVSVVSRDWFSGRAAPDPGATDHRRQRSVLQGS